MPNKKNLIIDQDILNDAYKQYFESYSDKLEVYYGGAGSGKSRFVCQKIVLKCLKSKRHFLITRKTNANIKRSVFKLFLTVLSQYGIRQYCKINQTDKTIILPAPYHSEITFTGCDDQEKLKSIEGITDVWMEEPTELTREDFDQILLRVRADVSDTQFFLSFNPITKAHWLYSYFWRGVDGKPENPEPEKTLIVKTTYKDNRFLRQDYIQTLEGLITSNPTWHKIYALGEFASLDKLIYGNNVDFEPFDPVRDPTGIMCIGLDFGYSHDPSALVWFMADEKKKEIWVYGERWMEGLLPDALAREITKAGFGKAVIIGDSEAEMAIDEMRIKHGITNIKPCEKGPGSVLYGITLLGQYKIHCHPFLCPHVKEAFENYAWKKDKRTNEYVNEPLHEYSHGMDAIRYGIQIVGNNKRITSLPKSALGL